MSDETPTQRAERLVVVRDGGVAVCGYWTSDADWDRADGGSTCGGCGLAYRDHPNHPASTWLTVLCSGSLVKL